MSWAPTDAYEALPSARSQRRPPLNYDPFGATPTIHAWRITVWTTVVRRQEDITIERELPQQLVHPRWLQVLREAGSAVLGTRWPILGCQNKGSVLCLWMELNGNGKLTVPNEMRRWAGRGGHCSARSNVAERVKLFLRIPRALVVVEEAMTVGAHGLGLVSVFAACARR